MKKTGIGKSALALSLLGCLIAAAPLFAHHGTAAFDTTAMVTVKGTVTEFVFANPHVRVFFDGKSDKAETGEMEKWQGELTAPNKLIRAGWNKNTLKPGDSVTISGYRMKSGDRTLWIRKLVTADGTALQLAEE